MSCQFCAPLDGLLQPPAVTTPTAVTTEVEIIVRIPVSTPLINWGVAIDKLTEALGGGEWRYRIPPHQHGRYEVEVRS